MYVYVSNLCLFIFVICYFYPRGWTCQIKAESSLPVFGSVMTMTYSIVRDTLPVWCQESLILGSQLVHGAGSRESTTLPWSLFKSTCSRKVWTWISEKIPRRKVQRFSGQVWSALICIVQPWVILSILRFFKQLYLKFSVDAEFA